MLKKRIVQHARSKSGQKDLLKLHRHACPTQLPLWHAANLSENRTLSCFLVPPERDRWSKRRTSGGNGEVEGRAGKRLERSAAADHARRAAKSGFLGQFAGQATANT